MRFQTNKQQQKSKKKKNLNTAFRMLLGQARSQVPRNRSQNRDRLDSRLQSDTTEGKTEPCAPTAQQVLLKRETNRYKTKNKSLLFIILSPKTIRLHVNSSRPCTSHKLKMFTAKYALRGGFVRQCCAVQSNVACSLTRRSITSAAGGRLFSQHGRPAAVVRGSCRIHTRPDDEVHNEQLRAKVEGRSEAERVCVASALHTHRAE